MPITTTITTTLSYAPTVALVQLGDSYGTVAAVTATFTVGDVWIIFLLAVLIVIELIRAVKEWRY